VRIATIVLLAGALSGGAAVARSGPPTPRVPPFAFTAALGPGASAVCFNGSSDVAHARRLTGIGYAETAWSPDGKRLAVAGGRTNTNPIRVETAAGRKLKPVTSPRLATEDDSNPAWSADGKTIAFSRYVFYGPHTDYRRAGIWTVDVATRRQRQLERSFADVLAWSPTGDVIAADLGNTGGREVIEFLSPGGTVVSRFELALGEFDQGASWSPDGKLLAVGGGAIIDRTGAIVARYAPPSTDAAASLIPSWAADGSILFERGATVYDARTNVRTLGKTDLYLAPAGGGPAVRLTQTPTVSEQTPAARPGSSPRAGTAQPCVRVGTRGKDVLRGTAGEDLIDGLGGNDVLRGGGGRDVLFGGPGNDRIYARDGKQDRVDGGPGRDRAWVDRRDHVSGVERVYRR
jgi:dipeptidyl aminopeptidase/acylaminoacyl peptidase